MAPPSASSGASTSASDTAAGGASTQPAAPPEWTTRYHEYLARTAGRSKHNHDLYRQVTARVAAGELAPTTLDGRLNSFLQLHGTEYANKLAEMSMRFLTGVVQAGTTYSYELVDRIIPGAVTAPEGGPPTFDPADWADWFARLNDYATRESAAVTEAVRDVLDRVARGELVPQRVQEAAASHRREQLPGSVARMVALYFDLLSGLDDLNSGFGEEYLGSVLAGDQPEQFSLKLRGRLGETAVVRLAVANTEAGATSVRCVVTDVRRADGIGPAFEPDLTITPERFELAAGEETGVVLSLRLGDGAYEPGPLYVGTLHVLTPGETLLEVPLRIRATAPLPAP